MSTDDDVTAFLADVRMQAEDHRLVPAHMVLPLLAAVETALASHVEAVIEDMPEPRFRYCSTCSGRPAWPCPEVRAITVALTGKEAGDSGQALPFMKADGPAEIRHVHKECQFREVTGPLAHHERTCRCYGGDSSETPGMTRRQEALEVWRRLRYGVLPAFPQRAAWTLPGR